MSDVCVDYRKEFADLLREIRIPVGDDSRNKLEKYSRLNCYITANMPKSLFRYRTLEPHNIEAFRKGTIPVSKPSVMKDIFDSLISVNVEKTVEELKRISGGMDAIAEYVYKGGEIPQDVLQSVSRPMRRAITKGKNRFRNNPQLKSAVKQLTPVIEKAFIEKIETKSEHIVDILKATGYIACFSESCDNLKMWSDYTNKHRCYVLEYDFETLNPRFHTFEKCGEQFLPDNIVLPVIYGEQYDSTEFVICYMANELLREVDKRDIYVKQRDELWHIKGYLYKDSDYESESEWRLITPIHGVSRNSNPYSDVSGVPKAIYYGAEIPEESFLELDAVAKEKQIMRYRMEVNTSERKVKAIKLD